MTNLFPAILLAGPPNCGKSVLAFLLTHRLRELGISHYLLRAVPDGEGDWFLTGQPDVVQNLRTIYKTGYSSPFLAHMHQTIERRPLPLLVDIGGRPQGDEQIGLIKACTHSILLYRTEGERLAWQKLLAEAKLLPIAELRSTLMEEESIEERQPILRGIIRGLNRDPDKRSAGMTFGVLLERMAGICSYDAVTLEHIHIKHAPYKVVNERELAMQVSAPVDGERITWSPRHLSRIPEFIPASQPLAIYGRGPVWLVSALAACTLPESFAIFDARYGWMMPPPVRFDGVTAGVKATILPFQSRDAWVELEIPGGTLEPDEISLPPLHLDMPDRELRVAPTQGGLVLSGKIPRWLFATLVHTLAPNHDWLAVDDPRLNQAILVHSNVSSLRAGDTLPRLVKPKET